MPQVSLTPEQVFREYEQGIVYKNGMGRRGLYEQNRINERFFAGVIYYVKAGSCG